MSDRYKILAQQSRAATENGGDPQLVELYSVPVPAATTVGATNEIEVAPESTSIHVQTLVTSIVVCNTAAATAGTFDLQLAAAPIDADPAVTSWLFKLNPLNANATKALSLGLVMSPGDKLYTDIPSTSGFTCDFSLMGIEIVSGGGPNG